ncbi:MAG: hypothetical protein GEEBNDBF_00362 [bacterium]|nr:hypothetical protein [bacterium]
MRSFFAHWTATACLLPVLAIFLTSCGGGGSSTPNTPGPGGGQQIGTGGTITGRVFVPEGQPIGGPFVTVTVKDSAGTTLSPTINPNGTGPDVGRFTVAGLPLGTDITVSIDYRSDGRGDNLGADKVVRLASTGALDLGVITLSNEYIELGWNAYRAKNFNLALSRFDTARTARRVAAETNKSSSYLVGKGWTRVKRGRDTLVMCSFSNNQGFEWEIALNDFLDAANTDQFDADARVGAAAAYAALNSKSKLLDPVQFNLQQFFYGFINPYHDEAEAKINEALLIAPDFKSDHDEIVASDLEVARLFHRFMQGKPVSESELESLADRTDLNQGSMETLQALSDLVRYKLAPQGGGGLTS